MGRRDPLVSSVAVIGSANADLVVRVPRFPAPGETVSGADLEVFSGGKSANQAVAAARLGSEVTFVAAIGDDGNGRLVRASLAADGIDTDQLLVRQGVPTGSAIITVDAHGENTIVLSPGANATLTAADVTAVSLAGARVLCLCLEIPMEAVIAAARAARAQGVQTIVNLSPFHTPPADLLRFTDVLITNEHEASLLGRCDVERSITTRGGRGCVVRDGERTVEIAAPRVDVVDTTRCGDAFLGAIAHGLAAGASLEDAARTAVRVAAIAATRVGAQGSYPTASALATFPSCRTPPHRPR